MNHDENVKVSICLVTYNQADFIGDCIQSIIDQDFCLPYEIIISDDCSTDDTLAIIKSFSDKYNFIKVIPREKNLGALVNYIDVHRHAIGEYVCHCDGDDIFLPGKLRTQVALLDSHPHFSMSVHAVKVINSDETLGNDVCLPEIGTVLDIINRGTYFVNSSVMYRRSCRGEYPEGFEAVDFYVHIKTAINGPIHLSRTILGGYRKHLGGISSSPVYRDKIERCYDSAYQFAIDSGIDKDFVRSAQVKRHLTFAFSRYFSGDVEGFKKRIKLNADEFQYASLLHKILYWTRSMPILMWCIKIARQIKNRKF
ncbi:glycosyltransferase family 2 protein [Rheinheimera oceanensis]|uniref:glycosyltransferase family 2 protein n=1 Tax=Rheinheimera oceanensis TaxID=2817449 RepID=UPI001BFD2A47|nr:glycosyltransferase family 2 protein [Rheinheimera oceanensis]